VGLVDLAVGHGASITRPVDAISAQFSLAFSVGLQFITGHNAAPDYFDADRRTDPEILAIGDLVEPYPMPIPEGDPLCRGGSPLVQRTSGGARAGTRSSPAPPWSMPSTCEPARQGRGMFRRLPRARPAILPTSPLRTVLDAGVPVCGCRCPGAPASGMVACI
jgi:hypothetical protein